MNYDYGLVLLVQYSVNCLMLSTGEGKGKREGEGKEKLFGWNSGQEDESKEAIRSMPTARQSCV